MKKYGVTVSYTETTYVEVLAENKQDAEDKAYDLASSGELESSGYDEPDYEFEVEEL